MAEVPISNDDYYDFKYYDHDDDNDFESDRIWGKAKRVRGDTEEAAQAVGGHSGIVLKSFVCYKCMSLCGYKYMPLRICEKTCFKQSVNNYLKPIGNSKIALFIKLLRLVLVVSTQLMIQDQ